MSAYMVIQCTFDDQDEAKMTDYETRTLKIVESYGGRPLARDEAPLAIERDYTPRLGVVLEFPSKQAQQDFYDSEEYAPLKEARHAFARAEAIVIG